MATKIPLTGPSESLFDRSLPPDIVPDIDPDIAPESCGQLRPLLTRRLPVIRLVYLSAIALPLLVFAFSKVTGYSIEALVRDPNVVLDGDPLIGIQSNLGVLIWFSAAVGCFVYWAIFKQLIYRPLLSRFFFWSGLVTLWLVIDDFFTVHEYLPEIFTWIGQPDVYKVYAIGFVIYLVCFRKRFLAAGDYGLGLSAAIFLGLSLGMDIIQESLAIPHRIFFEDGFKFVGIVSWSGYFLRFGFRALQENLSALARVSPHQSQRD